MSFFGLPGAFLVRGNLVKNRNCGEFQEINGFMGFLGSRGGKTSFGMRKGDFNGIFSNFSVLG